MPQCAYIGSLSSCRIFAAKKMISWPEMIVKTKPMNCKLVEEGNACYSE